MAAQVKLVRQTYDGGSDLSSLDLYANAAGFGLARNGWSPQVMAPNDKAIVETMTLLVKGSSHNDLATKLQNLAVKALEIQQDIEDIPTQQHVWLRAQLADESGARKAYISQIGIDIREALWGPPVSPGNFIRHCQLAVTRGHWERDTVPNILSLNSVGTLGGSGNYGTIVGDLPARIRILSFVGDVGGGGPLYELWAGFRTSRLGTVANFVPVWECEDGTLGTDASVDSTSEVNTASPGSGSGKFVEVDFSSSESLVTRLTVEVEDVTANADDQRGTFAVLVRAKVGASTTCRMRLLDGFSSSDDWRTQSRVVLSNTDWFMHALGTVVIPPTLGLSSGAHLVKFSLRLQAERISGSGSLKVDCFVLMPLSEGFVHVAKAAVQYSGGQTWSARVHQFPDYSIVGISWGPSGPIANLDVDLQRYGLPVGAGMLFLLAQRETQQILTDTCDLQIYHIPRWLMLRGSE